MYINEERIVSIEITVWGVVFKVKQKSNPWHSILYMYICMDKVRKNGMHVPVL